MAVDIFTFLEDILVDSCYDDWIYIFFVIFLDGDLRKTADYCYVAIETFYVKIGIDFLSFLEIIGLLENRNIIIVLRREGFSQIFLLRHNFFIFSALGEVYNIVLHGIIDNKALKYKYNMGKNRVSLEIRLLISIKWI